jgi:hypothetical protein
MGAVFSLGFIGEPENNPELNESDLWGPGDPFYGRKFFLADPLLIWRARPNYRGPHGYEFCGATIDIELNSLGLHDDEVAPKKKDHIRILNIGDSATRGLNLTRRADNYSDQLEGILNQQADPRTHYEVINAGIIGYSSLQGAELLVEDSRNPALMSRARYRALNNLSVWETINGRYREGESYARQIVSSADQEYFGSVLIHDWVHPNRAGNRLIAEAIATRFISR